MKERTRKLYLVFACLIIGGLMGFLPAFSARAGEDRWTTYDLVGYDVNTVVLDPTNPATVYACTKQGLLVSRDGGTTWTGMEGSRGNVTAAAVHFEDPAILFIAVDGALKRSDDGGKTWEAVGDALLGNVRWAGTHPLQPDVLYVSASQSLFRSPDRGATWSGAGVPVSGSAQAVAFDPSNADIAYVALANGQGIFRTTDGGRSWSLISEGLDRYAIEVIGMAVDPAGSLVLLSRGGVYRSTDTGQSWRQVLDSQEYRWYWNYGGVALAVDRGEAGVFYVAGGDGMVLRSKDSGESWEEFAGALPATAGVLVADPQVAGVLYAIANERLYKSQDGGAVWQGGPQYVSLEQLVAHPQEPAMLLGYVPGSAVLMRSQDGARTWESNSSGLENVRIRTLVFDPADPTVVYLGTDTGLYRSTDDGRTWVLTGLPTNVQVYSVAVDPMDSSTLYVGGSTGLLYSNNGGESWTAAPIQDGVSSIAIDPQTPGTVYVTAGDRLYRSDNRGETWQTLIHPGQQLAAVLLKPDDPATLYLTGRNGLFVSRDGGEGWSQAQAMGSSYVPMHVAVDPSRPQIVYLTWGRRIFVSPDAGVQWGLLEDGAPGLVAVDLVVDAGEIQTLYAAFTSGGGVWRYTLTRIPEPPTLTPSPSPSTSPTPYASPTVPATIPPTSSPTSAVEDITEEPLFTPTPFSVSLAGTVTAIAESRATAAPRSTPTMEPVVPASEDRTDGIGILPITAGGVALVVMVGAVFLWRRRSRGRSAPSDLISCPECGGDIPAGGRFCIQCGHRLKQE